MKLPRRSNFCVWPPALPRCRLCRGSQGPGLSGAAGALIVHFRQADQRTSWRV